MSEIKRRRKRIHVQPGVGNGNQLLALSMFIMLLAFFIVLNAVSNFEETKITPTMHSIMHAFASRVVPDMPENLPVMIEEEEADALNEGATIDRLEALFSSHIPNHEAVANQAEGTMHMRLPLDDFERSVRTIAGGGGDPFLPTLVALMRADTPENAYRMDMMLNVAINPSRMQNREPQQMAVHMRRISDIAARLEQAGLPPRLVAGGIQRGHPGTVDLYFRPYEPYSPVNAAEINAAGELQ